MTLASMDATKNNFQIDHTQVDVQEGNNTPPRFARGWRDGTAQLASEHHSDFEDFEDFDFSRRFFVEPATKKTEQKAVALL